MPHRSVIWFRQDLRLADNPALVAAAAKGEIVPIYILDDGAAGDWRMGSASRVWLHHALFDLNQSLGGRLQIFQGNAEALLPEIVQQLGVKEVHWNRCYEPWRRERDARLKTALTATGIEVQSHNASLLWEPWTVRKSDGMPYRVFTPFYKKGCLSAPPPRTPMPRPQTLTIFRDYAPTRVGLEALGLVPNHQWPEPMMRIWEPTEAGAARLLARFLDETLAIYATGRDIPARNATSRLSPYLHFGQISPHQIWHALESREPDRNTERFRTELAWREFSCSLLFDHPGLPDTNLQARFDGFPWRHGFEVDLSAWQRGMTGIPIVDAGMRELWQTGYMHNRVRMIVASFLVKNLLIDWRHGQRWFWDTLVDADLANNAASWQWVAGSGADAAPYFRIFNPVLQAAKFDPEGTYIKTYLPELEKLAPPHLFDPSSAPEVMLAKAGITLGENYPRAIVDLADSRGRALAAYARLRATTEPPLFSEPIDQL